MLRFRCTGCGDCCRFDGGAPGFVVALDELPRLADKMLLKGRLHFSEPGPAAAARIAAGLGAGDGGLVGEIEAGLTTVSHPLDSRQPRFRGAVRAHLAMVPRLDGSCWLRTERGCAAYDSRPHVCRVYPLSPLLPLSVAEAAVAGRGLPEGCDITAQAPPLLESGRLADEGYGAAWAANPSWRASLKAASAYVCGHPFMGLNGARLVANAIAGQPVVNISLTVFVDAALHFGLVDARDAAWMLDSQIVLAERRIQAARAAGGKGERALSRQLERDIAGYHQYRHRLARVPVSRGREWCESAPADGRTASSPSPWRDGFPRSGC